MLLFSPLSPSFGISLASPQGPSKTLERSNLYYLAIGPDPEAFLRHERPKNVTQDAEQAQVPKRWDDHSLFWFLGSVLIVLVANYICCC